MNETKSEPSTELCPIKLVHQYQWQKLGLTAVGRELDASCPTACAGLRSEPRALGKVTLPKMFDRIYCDNPEAVTLQD